MSDSGDRPSGFGDQPADSSGWGSAPPPPPPPGQYGSSFPPPQTGYGGPGAGGQVPNYLVWAILTTIFCCLPAGIVSIVYAAQVNSKLAVGDYAGAQQSSKNARQWAIISAVAGVVVIILYIVFVLVLGVVGAGLGSTSGEFG